MDNAQNKSHCRLPRRKATGEGAATPGAAPPKSPRTARRWWLITTIAVLLAAFTAVGFYRGSAGPGYPLDDTWIHLAFARNVASGLGFGANAHEPTPGATSPLWVLLLAPGFLFGAVHDTWPWVLATILLAGAGVMGSALFASLVRATTRSAKAPPAWSVALCGISIVWTAPLVWSTAGAMEVPLFAALVCATLLAFARSPAPAWRGGLLWGALAGAAALSRPEGLLLAPLLALVVLCRPGRSALVEAAAGVAVCGIVYSPSIVFCLATSGHIFPNTFYAKTTALVAGAPDLRFLTGAVKLLYDLSPAGVFALFAGIAATIVSVWRRRNIRGPLATAAFAVGLPLAYAAMGRTYLFAPFAGNFGRYLYPVLPVALVLGFWAVATAAEGLRSRAASIAALAIIAFAAVLSGVGTIRKVDLYRHNVSDVNTKQVAMAHRLREKFAPGDLIAANDVGALAYFTRFRVLDLVGIVSTPTLHALERAEPGPRGRARAHYALLVDERPAGLVAFPEWFGEALARLGPVVEPVESITNRADITSPFPTLVAYRLDWSRLAD